MFETKGKESVEAKQSSQHRQKRSAFSHYASVAALWLPQSYLKDVTLSIFVQRHTHSWFLLRYPKLNLILYQMLAMMPNHIDEPTPKPLGDFHLFPREVRDEIYQHIFSEMYEAFYSSSIVKPAFYDRSDDHWLLLIKRDREERTGSDLSILRLQKAITKEAMQLLYSEATFYSCYNVRPDYFPHSPQPGNVDITERTTYIAISCDIGCASEMDSMPGVTLGWSSMSYPSARAGPLTFFQRISITKESILVNFKLYKWSIYTAGLTVSPLFEALKQLTGFKTVTLRLTFMSDHYYPAQETSEAAIQELLEARQSEKLYGGFGPLLSAMNDALEPALGTKGVMELLVSAGDGLSWRHRQCVTTFHPQAHLAAISKTTKMQQLPVTT